MIATMIPSNPLFCLSTLATSSLSDRPVYGRRGASLLSLSSFSPLPSGSPEICLDRLFYLFMHLIYLSTYLPTYLPIYIVGTRYWVNIEIVLTNTYWQSLMQYSCWHIFSTEFLSVFWHSLTHSRYTKTQTHTQTHTHIHTFIHYIPPLSKWTQLRTHRYTCNGTLTCRKTSCTSSSRT